MKKDWCTAWPDKWRDIDYSECCHQHDLDYAQIKAGPNPLLMEKQRRLADIKLMKCVQAKGLPVMGLIMLFGVRLFGYFLYWNRVKGKGVDLASVDFSTINDV